MLIVWLIVWLLKDEPKVSFHDWNAWAVSLAVCAVIDLLSAIKVAD